MPAAIPNQQRREIVDSREAGESFVSIAQRLKLSYQGVRQIYHRYVQTGCLTPAYDRCAHKEVRHDPALYQQAIALKAAHPGWGAGLIGVELRAAFQESELPSRRTLQRWFRRGKVQRQPRERVAKVTVRRGQVVHEVWAMDAKEQIRLGDGSYASWLTITDEASGGVLDARLFPPQALESDRSDPSEGKSASDDDPLGTAAATARG